MKTLKITALKKAVHQDLIDKYENPIEHACNVVEGQVFICKNLIKPKELCESAWESILPFAKILANGGGNFYNGWMKNERSAMISCNDGFRPVSFYVEVID